MKTSPRMRKNAKEQQDKTSKPNGLEIGYQRFTINGKGVGLWRGPFALKRGNVFSSTFLNASATEKHPAGPLPGHQFQVVALDGKPCAAPAIGERGLNWVTAERISAVVEMKNPGVWILGTPRTNGRFVRNGMGNRGRVCEQNRRPSLGQAAEAALGLHDVRRKLAWSRIPSRPSPLAFGKINGGPGPALIAGTINGKGFDESAQPRTPPRRASVTG